jgi:hypothetical protein
MSIMEFGQRSFVHTTGLKERIEKAEKEMQMRQYRGLTKDTKRWAYGWYCQVEGKHYIVLDDAIIDEDDYGLYCGIEGFVEVIPETVGQQTGRKDKNGKESYFGDIFKDNEGHLGVIRWNSQALRVYFKWNDGQVSYPNPYPDYIDLEVIGNIHQHPELMEQGDGE